MTLGRVITSSVIFAAGVLVGLLVREPLLTICGREAADGITVVQLKGTATSPSDYSGTPEGRKETFYNPWLDPGGPDM